MHIQIRILASCDSLHFWGLTHEELTDKIQHPSHYWTWRRTSKIFILVLSALKLQLPEGLSTTFFTSATFGTTYFLSEQQFSQ